MVFWATVLAFIVGIMYYMTYPHDTKIKEVYMPASEAYVAGFLAQHQAAKDFAREGALALNNLTASYNGSEAGGKSVLVLSHSNPEKSLLDPYMLQTVSSVATESLRPAALTPDSDNNSGFVSVMGCFDSPERKLEKSADYVRAKLVDCRAATTKYVMTYGPLPDDSSSPYRKNKTLLWEQALLKRSHGNPDCGFLFYDAPTKRFFVNNSKRLTRNIPVAFTDLLDGYVEKTQGRAYVNGFADSAEVLFCISPINDPYPRLGLQVHLDGTINTLPVGTHAETIPEGGWINLVDEEGTGKARVQNVGGNDSWFVSACQGEECAENRMGFSFNKERLVQVLPLNGISSNKKLFGMPFTISFMADFNNGSYPVFATRNTDGDTACTPSYEEPCVSAEYNSGTLTVNVRRESMPMATLSATVLPGEMTQVDYLFNADSQRLYINGQLKASNVFPSHNELTYKARALTGTGFVLGGEHADFDLYNFLIYTRSPDTDTKANDKFDLYGLPRVYKTNTERYIKPR